MAAEGQFNVFLTTENAEFLWNSGHFCLSMVKQGKNEMDRQKSKVPARAQDSRLF
jgi:hypothetical protein